MKVGEISLKHAKAEDKFYSQLSVEVNVKSIPRNFGAYDFQPTYLEKHTKENIDMSELAQSIINNLVRDLWEEETINERKEKIKEIYQKELIYMNQRVTIYDKKYEHIHYTGRFVGVDEEGNALLEEFKKPFEDGVMKFDSGAKDYLSLYRGDY
jgi:biotin-(acetyl-CoA carboxylase) ligase